MEPIKATIKVSVEVRGKRQLVEVPAMCLGCFGVVQGKTIDDASKTDYIRPDLDWYVVHLASGLQYRYVYPTQDQALDYIRDVSTVTDWTGDDPNRITNTDDTKKKARAIKNIYGGEDCPWFAPAPARLERINEHAIRPCNLEDN